MTNIKSSEAVQIDLYVPKTDLERQQWRNTVTRAAVAFKARHAGLCSPAEMAAMMIMIGFREMYALAEVHQPNSDRRAPVEVGRQHGDG